MKKFLLVMLVLMFSFSLVLAGCGGGTDENVAPPEETGTVNEPSVDAVEEEPPAEAAKDLSGEITIWTFADGTLLPIIPIFNEKYPNVKVNVTPLEFNENHEKALTAIAAGTGGPDILMIEGGWIKKFNSIEGLEDLLQPPYNLGQIKSEFTDGNWGRWLSLDGKKLIGFPWDMPPGVTFYRSDIMEEFGFPSDPVELGEYMKDPTNVINMAKTLKAQDKYMFEWRDQPMGLYNSGIGFFDRDLSWVRNTESWIKGLDLAKQITQDQLYLNQSIWSEEGQQAINSGKLPFVYLGSWGQGNIKDWGANAAGKWRATVLPFGAYGGMGGSTLSILSQSPNKELAFEFINFALASEEGQTQNAKDGIMPGWKPAWDLPAYSEPRPEMLEFYGGQILPELYASIVEKIPASIGTPLDDAANTVFMAGINDALDKNLDSTSAMAKIAEDVEKAISVDKDKLLKSMGK